MIWPNVNESPGPLAPGRYCLAVCYCRQCDHYEPLPPMTSRRIRAALNRPTYGDPTWWDPREDSRW